MTMDTSIWFKKRNETIFHGEAKFPCGSLRSWSSGSEMITFSAVPPPICWGTPGEFIGENRRQFLYNSRCIIHRGCGIYWIYYGDNLFLFIHRVCKPYKPLNSVWGFPLGKPRSKVIGWGWEQHLLDRDIEACWTLCEPLMFGLTTIKHGVGLQLG